jgi:hypothetical protein
MLERVMRILNKTNFAVFIGLQTAVLFYAPTLVRFVHNSLAENQQDRCISRELEHLNCLVLSLSPEPLPRLEFDFTRASSLRIASSLEVSAKLVESLTDRERDFIVLRGFRLTDICALQDAQRQLARVRGGLFVYSLRKDELDLQGISVPRDTLCTDFAAPDRQYLVVRDRNFSVSGVRTVDLIAERN